MQRLLTAAVAVPLALAAVFLLPSAAFFALALAVVECAAFEFVRLARRGVPHAPLAALLLLVPAAAVILSPELLWGTADGMVWEHLMSVGAMLSLVVAALVLFARTPVEECVCALGALAFGTLYFAVPVASLFHLHRLDPWVVLLLVAIVWLGDSAAYYFGSRFGRRRLAPVVSPNKTWEGAAAGLAAAILATAAWSHWRLGSVGWPLLLVGAATDMAGQVGDLVESMLKRSARVKDTGRLFPGHGGMLDRIDALLFAAPALLLGLWVLGYGAVTR